MRRFTGVRAAAQRGDAEADQATDVDRLAATLAEFWAEGAQAGSPLTRLAETGEITDATVAALRRDLELLERSIGSDAGNTGASQLLVGCLLAYAEVHAPRGPVPGWAQLRSDQSAARLFAVRSR